MTFVPEAIGHVCGWACGGHAGVELASGNDQFGHVQMAIERYQNWSQRLLHEHAQYLQIARVREREVVMEVGQSL